MLGLVRVVLLGAYKFVHIVLDVGAGARHILAQALALSLLYVETSNFV